MGIDPFDKWLVREMQSAHDDDLRLHGIDAWKTKMRYIAGDYQLDASILD
jgi:hypothetical protein